MNPLDRFDPNVESPRDFMDRLLAKQRLQERERERREAIRRNESIARVKKAKAEAPTERVRGIPKNQSPPTARPNSLVPPMGSGQTAPNTPPKPNSDPFGLDTLRYNLAKAKEEAQRLRAAADAVLAIHRKIEDKREGRDFYCSHCSTPYPCITVEALLVDSE